MGVVRNMYKILVENPQWGDLAVHGIVTVRQMLILLEGSALPTFPFFLLGEGIQSPPLLCPTTVPKFTLVSSCHSVGLGWHCSSNITSLIPTPTIFKGNNRSNFGNPHLYVLGCKSSDILEFSHLKFLQGICTN